MPLKQSGAERALREIARGASITFAVTLLGYLGIFVFKLLAARHFGPHDYGLFEMVNTLFGIFSLLAALGISPGIAQYVATYRVKQERSLLKGYLKFILWVPFLTSLGITAVVWFAAPWIAGFFTFGPSFADLIRAASWFLPLRALNESISYALQAEKRVLTGSLGYNVIERIVLVIGMLVIIHYDLPLFYLIMVFGASLIASLLFHFRAGRHLFAMVWDDTASVSREKEWILFSLPLLLTSVFYYVLSWTDNFVIGTNLTGTDLGVYGATYSFASYLLFIPPIFFSIFIPVITERAATAKEELPDIVVPVRKWWFIVATFFGALFIVLPKQVLAALYGAEFSAGYLSFLILSVCFLISVYLSVANSILLINKDTKFILASNIFFSLLNLTAILVLIRHYPSILVVAIGSGVSMVLLRIAETVRSSKYIAVPWQLGSAFKTLAVAFASVLLTTIFYRMVILKLFAATLLSFGLALALYTIIYTILVVSVRLFTRTDAIMLDIIEEHVGVKLPLVRKLLFR